VEVRKLSFVRCCLIRHLLSFGTMNLKLRELSRTILRLDSEGSLDQELFAGIVRAVTLDSILFCLMSLLAGARAIPSLTYISGSDL
jgi:hypothetical protein